MYSHRTSTSQPPTARTHRWLLLLALLAFSLVQSACNTTQGVGRDVRAVGRGVERAGSGR